MQTILIPLPPFYICIAETVLVDGHTQPHDRFLQFSLSFDQYTPTRNRNDSILYRWKKCRWNMYCSPATRSILCRRYMCHRYKIGGAATRPTQRKATTLCWWAATRPILCRRFCTGEKGKLGVPHDRYVFTDFVLLKINRCDARRPILCQWHSVGGTISLVWPRLYTL